MAVTFKREHAKFASKNIQRSSFSQTKRVVLIFALCLEVFAILSNWTALWRMLETPKRSFQPSALKRRHQRQRPVTVFLEFKFVPKPGRLVEDMWGEARDPDHKFPEFKSILRNPGTLDSKNGEEECIPAADWQTEFYPVCNSFHELGFSFNRRADNAVLDTRTDDTILELLGVGTSIHAWKATKDNENVVLKTLQIDCPSGCAFDDKFYHKQRLDAVAAERLTSSPYVLDVYGFCGMSVMNEFGRFLKDIKGLSMLDRLRYSRDLAAGMNDLFSIGGASHAMLTHGDFKPSNVIFSQDGSSLKLSDFNKGRFLGWNAKAKEPCGYLSARSFSGAYILAPEEWFGKVRTEKTDIYHLGGMIFYLLTGNKPYNFNKQDLEGRDERFETKGEWALPNLPDTIEESDDPIVVAMRKVIKKTLLLRKEDRAPAEEVLQLLNSTLTRIERTQQRLPLVPP